MFNTPQAPITTILYHRQAEGHQRALKLMVQYTGIKSWRRRLNPIQDDAQTLNDDTKSK